MNYDSKEINRISKNLSLRLSPERKYAPKTYLSSTAFSTRNNYSPKYCCCCCGCAHYCHSLCCPCYCCCCHCCHLNFDYGSIDSPNKLNEKDRNENNKLENPNQNENEEKEPEQIQKENNYFSYEQNQFNDFLKKLIEAESRIEDAKINLSENPDFNCEEVFRLFDTYDRDILTENDLKKGLNSIGINPTDQEVRLLMKRFDLQKKGNLNYGDFFDIIVPFEKNYRNKVENRAPNSYYCRNPESLSPQTMDGLKFLFNLIINYENEINNMRKLFGSLRINLREIFGNLDKRNRGFFDVDEMKEYLQNNELMENTRDGDLLYIRLDKNRNGKIDYQEIEDEIQTLY